MTLLSCPRETEVRDAAAAGRWTATLREHASSCRICADVALVVRTLASSPPPRLLPGDPAVLWMHARLARRLHAEAQISRLLTAVQTVVGVALLAALTYAGSLLDLRSQLPQPAVDRVGVAAAGSLLLAAILWIARRAGRRRTSQA